MASKIKVTPQKEEKLEKESRETPLLEVASKLMFWMSNLLPLPVSRSLRPFSNGSWGSTRRWLPESFHQSKFRSKSPCASWSTKRFPRESAKGSGSSPSFCGA